MIGSYATGTAKRTSDLDLLIVQASTKAKRKRDDLVEFLLAPLLIPVDVNVYTPAEFDEECRQLFGFARTATELQGKLVYSRELGDFASLGRRSGPRRPASRGISACRRRPPSGSSTRHSTRVRRAAGRSRHGRSAPPSCTSTPALASPTSAAASAPWHGRLTGRWRHSTIARPTDLPIIRRFIDHDVPRRCAIASSFSS